MYLMFTYIYNERERDSWLIAEKTFVYLFKNSGIWQRKMELRWEGGYTTVYNLTFAPSCNFARHKSDLSPNQTRVDLSFLKDAARRSYSRLWPQDAGRLPEWNSLVNQQPGGGPGHKIEKNVLIQERTVLLYDFLPGAIWPMRFIFLRIRNSENIWEI
jgi:hypothetical protein